MQFHEKGKSKEVLYPYSVWERKRHSSDYKEIKGNIKRKFIKESPTPFVGFILPVFCCLHLKYFV